MKVSIRIYVFLFCGVSCLYQPTLHKTQENQNLIRLLDPYQDQLIQNDYTYGDTLLRLYQNTAYQLQLLDTLGFCKKGKLDDYSLLGWNYHLLLWPCESIHLKNFRILPLDTTNKVVGISTFEGDSYHGKGESLGWGCFFVFERMERQWTLRDVALGRLTAVEQDSSKRWMPILFGRTYRSYDFPKDSNSSNGKDNYVETRLRWDGEHLQTNEVMSCGNFYRSGKRLGIDAMAKAGLYDSLRQVHIDAAEIQKGVKLHYKFRAFSLNHRSDSEYLEMPYVQNRWRNGFRMD